MMSPSTRCTAPSGRPRSTSLRAGLALVTMMVTMMATMLVAMLVCTLPAAGHPAEEPDYPIRPVPFTDVEVDDDFWSPRIRTNRDVTVWYDFRKCEETGRIENFEVAGGLKKGGFQGIYFNDSDVFKVIEGAAYLLALEPDEKLDAYLDALIAKIAAAQEDDGYLYTARTIGDPSYDYPGKEARWSRLDHGHELYNVGHLYEAAVAHWQATGKRSLLEVAIRNADLVDRVFGLGADQRRDVPGHEEIEIGLVKLYRATRERRYLDLAKLFIDLRGRRDLRGEVYGTYAQDHVPVVEQTEAVGHAVRGGYLYAGVADVAAMTGERATIDAIDRIWEDVVSRKLYLIGNVGQHGAGEGYAGAYTLPNVEAYNETCAAIALALWNHRMFLLHGDAKYIDVLERIAYNAFLAGVSLSGDRFFYPNPLACDLRFRFNHGALERSPWFGCSCCPVNVVRFLPSLAGMVYAQKDRSVWVNLFVGGSTTLRLPEGELRLTQRTRYPWEGRVRIEVEPSTPSRFALHVRAPGWARGEPLPSDLYRYVDAETAPIRVTLDGEPIAVEPERGYVVIERRWTKGDAVELELPLSIRRVLAHEKLEDDRGRVAIERGPIVYCIEGADHDGAALSRFLPDGASLRAEHRPGLLGGVTVLTGEGRAATRGASGEVVDRAAPLTLIPYYAWCHRGPNDMQVWIPRSRDLAKVAPPATLATRSRASASHTWQLDSVEAINDGIEPQSSGDHEVPRFTWWPRRGTKEWAQYDLAEATTVSSVAIYWFDDTGRGQCRVPEGWRLLWHDGETWRPVAARGAAGTAKDRFNRLDFAPVEARALRVEAELRDGFSAGILEWTVGAEAPTR